MIGIVTLLIATVFIGLREVSKAEAEEVISDVNGDGIINLLDARILAPPSTISCPVCVDVNGDKQINQLDANLVQEFVALQTSVSTQDPDRNTRPVYKARYDVNNDQIIDSNDIVQIQNYINQQVTGSAFGLEDPSELTYGYMARNLIIRFKPEIGDTQKQELFARYNLTLKLSIIKTNTVLVETPNNNNVEDLQKSVALEPTVQSTRKNEIAELLTDDPRWGDQWGHRKIRLEETWYTETTGRTNNKIRVGVIDSGVSLDSDLNYNHYDLGPNLSSNRRYNAAQDAGLPFSAQDVTDTLGHGTHMAGIIGATTNNNLGIAGVNWNVEIIPIKACFATIQGEGECPIAYLYAALSWAEVQDLDILNMSLGWQNHYQANDNDNGDFFMDNMLALGVIIIAAAGNDSRNECIYPAAHAGVICVGATAQNDALAVGSSGRVDADILAPGVAILSTVPTNSLFDANGNGVESLNNDNLYGGTSMASAYVSGVTALCMSVAPPDTTRAPLKCNNNYQHNGFGRIDAWATVWLHNCFKIDNNDDNMVNTLDLQGIAFRSNAPSRYLPRYDIFPVGGDSRIDESDLWLTRAWYGISCVEN